MGTPPNMRRVTFLSRDIDNVRKIWVLTQILPYLAREISLFQRNPRQIKRLKVQTCLLSSEMLKKVLVSQEYWS
jgi:hypothetical protein